VFGKVRNSIRDRTVGRSKEKCRKDLDVKSRYFASRSK